MRALALAAPLDGYAMQSALEPTAVDKRGVDPVKYTADESECIQRGQVEAKDDSRPTPATILHHIRNLLAGNKKPKHVFIVDALPRNSLGKVLKVELRERATHLVPTVK
ncbi:hypothetical protein AB8A31_09320 [Tardiphaga sp. 804_B3_N1_9]|uniref:hypothetical protein n=1 Tax=Tardiphaga sp. 804_B3_N1_9 TaxID=3240786 RepID=UPI003F23D155